MHVLLVHSSSHGSRLHRIEEPARAIREAGADVEITVTRGLTTTVRPADGEVVAVEARGADVVVMQLPKTAGMLQTLRLLQAQGVAVVVELDDLLSAVAYGSGGYGALVRDDMSRLALECAREADLVTVSTPPLLDEYARHGRGAVVPNAVPRRIAELPPAYERTAGAPTVGWTGSVGGHPYDLQEIGSGLRQALDRTPGSRFVVIGQKLDARSRLGLVDEPGEISWLPDLDDYLRTVGEVLDVGLAPLRADRFNECKSWLKPLEYSSRGVFAVRARTPEYERLGLGAPARAPKDWTKWITTGLQDGDRRRELAAAAHATVLRAHLTEHTAERWVGAWRTALDNRARAQSPGRRLTAARS